MAHLVLKVADLWPRLSELLSISSYSQRTVRATEADLAESCWYTAQ